MFGENEADFTEDIPEPRANGNEDENNKRIFPLAITALGEIYDLGKF